MRYILLILLSVLTVQYVMASSDSQPDRYVREAQYYQRKAEKHRKEAAYHLKKAESYQREAAYYTKKGKADTAKSYQRKAEQEMDTYRTQLKYSPNAEEKAASYLKRASKIHNNKYMKILIPTMIPCYLSTIILSGCSNAKNSNHETVGTLHSDDIEAIVEDTIFTSSEYFEEKEKSEYRGNLIVEYDNIKMYADFCLSEEDSKYGDDITAKDETYLVRYVDDIPRDSMVLKGPYNTLSGKNNVCKITVGTDTVNVNISKPLNNYLDLRFVGVLPECRFYRYSKHYTLSERSFPTDFQINLAIPNNARENIKNYINETIRDDVARYFGYYSGDKTIYPNIPLFNIKDGDFDQLSRYYYRQFCRLYTKENTYEPDENEDIDEEDMIPRGPHYSYQFYAYPVWESSDSALTTWKFYDYCYLGGAHGGETEYFLTFDNNTGRILGVDDFYTKDKFNKAINLLRHQLNAYHNRGVSDEYSYSAELDFDSNVTAVQSTILSEVVGEKLYPRPALTRQGIVFTYQTYEKGSNADGVLHFTQPYDNDFKLKR